MYRLASVFPTACATLPTLISQYTVPHHFVSSLLSSLQTWIDVIVTRAKGLGKVCPEELDEEKRKCVKDCPAGAVDPSEAIEGSEGGDDTDKGEGVEMKPEEDEVDIPETYCSIEQELWTPCSAECKQERYLDDACEKEAEVSQWELDGMVRRVRFFWG